MVNVHLKKILSNKGITQSELARATGIRPSTICDLYNQNATFVKLENVYKICNYLKCDVSELFEIADE